MSRFHHVLRLTTPQSRLCVRPTLARTSHVYSNSLRHFGSAQLTANNNSNKGGKLEKIDTKGLRRKRTSHPKQVSNENENDFTELDEEYIPEMDWDHTRFHDHYERIWEAPKEAPTIRESVYNVGLRLLSFTAISVAIGCVAFGSFVYFKMRKQLKHVNSTQKLLRKTRKIFESNPSMIPLSLETMDVTDIKNELMQFIDTTNDSNNNNNNANNNDTNNDVNRNEFKLDLNRLENESEMWKLLISNKVEINRLADWQKTGTISLEDTTYLLALMQYFMSQSRKKGTPSIRRQLRDDLYKMISSYDGTNKVTLKNMGAFGNACFCLAILSPPNLGKEELGGQNIDDFKVNYVRYMLRDEELKQDSEVPLRRFNFLYKVCDFSIGLTPESQGQLAK